jgi:hypothetical protein
MRTRHLVDEFGEWRELKTEALTKARRLGHQLSGFHLRPNDPTKAQAYCRACGAFAVVNTDGDGPLPALYGQALARRSAYVAS